MGAAARSLGLTPVALAAAGMVALGPAVVSPPAPPPALPVMHVGEIALAGIGQDIYQAVSFWVREAVGGVSYLVNFIPIIGGPIAAQININYFQGIQPVVEATVNYLAALVQDPFDFPAATSAYGGALYDIGYNWVSAELMFFGLQPLPPLPQGAAARPESDAAPAAAVAPVVRASVTKAPVAEAPVVTGGADAAPVEPAVPEGAAEPGVDDPVAEMPAPGADASAGAGERTSAVRANAHRRPGRGAVPAVAGAPSGEVRTEGRTALRAARAGA